MFAALDLAKYIVRKCVDDNQPVSNLQLQKILYNIQKFYLYEFNVPFFVDDIEAWQFGPVVPNVYYHYCGYGAMPITNEVEAPVFNIRDIVIINNIVETKRCLSPWVLVAESHRPGGAWDRVFQNGLGNHKVIPLDYIREEI